MNNDLISREALKDDFDRIGFNDYDDYERALRIIDDAPTVEAVPLEFHEKVMEKTVGELIECQLNLRPKGKWKSTKQGGIPITDMCTNCYYKMKWYKNKYNFCPNCGADMRGDEE